MHGVEHSGMSRESEKAGSAQREWDGEKGVHMDIRQGGWERGLVGVGRAGAVVVVCVSWGPRWLLGLGSREKLGQMV